MSTTPLSLEAALPYALTGVPSLPGLGRARSGKVRDAFDLADGKMLLVTSDRVSAFDRVLGTIPYKGQVLNQLAAWWFQRTRHILPNHLLAVPDANCMVVRRARPLPVEVVVRGFLTGVTSTSLWTMYSQGVQRPYGIDLPAGMKKNDRLPTPVITPTTKAAAGQHDAPLTSEDVVNQGLVDAALWRRVTTAALALFAEGQAVAERAGLLLVDTKYELGLVDGPEGEELVLIDEVHTPDSSRYWTKSGWEAGRAEPLDKERLRIALADEGYKGDGPPPPLSDAIRVGLAATYLELFERLTGAPLVPAEQPAGERIERMITTPIVPILMGSRSDLEHARSIVTALDAFGIAGEIRVASAHKSPGYLLEMLAAYESDPRPKVYLTVAGRSNALSGMVCAAVTAPVVSVPPYSDRFGGADVFSSLRMPSGVAPALVMDPDNAALFCAKVLGLGRVELQDRVARLHHAHRGKLMHDDAELRRR
ncbi:MAG: AIR carboxylase family protein [Deltaproteobacteria bacterium]|nr:AIR carboxylase family protein [Deltaproteobacteria bacterium]